ncbi:Hypp2557 [Branchiostoma lanceolatum]|uniref:Fucosyltransferase n=1 Tax=Branchiostoma lanceolatum TaxID=7740 RepID=A0A8K0EQM1_BRALA|nr:Hypp2557 [Branchiostoma lanceolatum]
MNPTLIDKCGEFFEVLERSGLPNYDNLVPSDSEHPSARFYSTWNVDAATLPAKKSPDHKKVIIWNPTSRWPTAKAIPCPSLPQCEFVRKKRRKTKTEDADAIIFRGIHGIPQKYRNDFESPEALANYLNYLDQNDDKYNEYFAWKTKPPKNLPDLFESRFCDVCKKLLRRPRRRGRCTLTWTGGGGERTMSTVNQSCGTGDLRVKKMQYISPNKLCM